MDRYSVCYKGIRYFGDSEDWNVIDFDDLQTAICEYKLRKNEGFEAYVKDNEYDCCYENGEWY